jgi:hypothetical protein
MNEKFSTSLPAEKTCGLFRWMREKTSKTDQLIGILEDKPILIEG